MSDEVRATLAQADVPLVPGMLTDLGRVVSVDEDQVQVAADGELRAVPVAEPIPDLDDLATWLLCLGVLASRTGLEPGAGFLFYLSDDAGDRAWVLEGADEVRTRDADTEDPKLALARALAETL
jgi:hypothetical protein